MSIIFTDKEINSLIQERKVLPDNWGDKFKKRMNRGSNEYLLDITGEDGNKFRVIVRKSVSDESNFSVVLGVKVPTPKKYFRLRRYNGNNHEHNNPIENEVVTGFHIHTATERYQVNR